MKDLNLPQEWIDLAPSWIKEMREGRNAHRKGILDPAMVAACGSLKGLKVLDSGCGEGRFCRMLAQEGASYVLGVDLCLPLIEAAKEIQGEQEAYQVGDVEDLSWLEENSFDLAISYLNQVDLINIDLNNQAIFRVLKAGGRFIVSTVHPMRSSTGVWKKDIDGNKEHVMLDRYFEEGPRQWTMMGKPLTNFHYTFSTQISSFLDAGFTLEGIIEPSVTPENMVLYPEVADEIRVPGFIIYQLKKG